MRAGTYKCVQDIFMPIFLEAEALKKLGNKELNTRNIGSIFYIQKIYMFKKKC